MAGYKKILLVVDLSDDSAHIGARARDMAQRDNAALEILHVVEFVPVEPMGETLMPTVQIEAELVNRARQRITQLAEELGAHDATLHIEAGSVKTEIVRVARETDSVREPQARRLFAISILYLFALFAGLIGEQAAGLVTFTPLIPG